MKDKQELKEKNKEEFESGKHDSNISEELYDLIYY